jgi:Flp pilus assembly protein TadG
MKQHTRSGRRRGDGRRGAALVEAALVLPLVFLFLLGIMEYARFLMFEHVFNNAVRAGAIYAAKHGDPVVIDNSSGAAVTYGNAVTDVTNQVTTDLGGEQLSNQAINVFLSDNLGNNVGTWPGGQPGQYVCVQLTGSYQFMIPALLRLPSTLTTQFQSVQPCEGN